MSIELPQPSPADQSMDAPVARMSVRVGVHDANAQVAIAAPSWNGDETAKLSDTHEDNMLAWEVVRALNQAEAGEVAQLELFVDYGNFPKDRAAKIVFGHVHGHLLRATVPERVTFVFASPADADLFQRVAQNRRAWMGSPRKVM